jgi:hypothetical protein
MRKKDVISMNLPTEHIALLRKDKNQLKHSYKPYRLIPYFDWSMIKILSQ